MIRQLGLRAFTAVVLLSTIAHAAGADDARKKDEAREHFELGLSHFDRGEWSAALAEFLRSRAIFPTRVATKDAAICLRKEGRFDEARDMFRALLREFPDLSPTDRELANTEIAELEASIGQVVFRGGADGASITLDGKPRGNLPSAPIAVGAGTHVVRVYKEGFAAFEERFDVAGKQTVTVSIALQRLASQGRLHVSEKQGHSLSVVVDGVTVGTSPWDGTLAPGPHVVLLRGAGSTGTQPSSVVVKNGETTNLTLAEEELSSELRITPTPSGANVSIDGVAVGHGIWEGALRAGDHVIEGTSDGFLASRRTLTLKRGERQALTVELERDPTSPLWNDARAGFLVELDGGYAFGVVSGGDLAQSCTDDCKKPSLQGPRGVLHGAYRTASGVAFGFDAGYLLTTASFAGRSTALAIQGRAPVPAHASDDVRLAGPTIGLSVALMRGDPWRFTLRAGAGIFLGTARDIRTGTVATPAHGTETIASQTETPLATYLYGSPEVRFGRRFGRHFEVNIGVEALILGALSQPSWANDQKFTVDAGGANRDTATYPKDTIFGTVLVYVIPGLGLRYDF